jgi:recombinational DNA repair protein (RecF pathway)
MLYADARSARLEKSKQRYALQDFSYLRISLVKGKRGWRIGSVESITNHYQAAIDKAARGSVVKVYRALRRFYSGEEPAPQVFDRLLEGLNVLVGSVTDRSGLEQVLLVSLLYELGYVDKKQLPAAAQAPLQSTEELAVSTKRTLERLLEHATNSSQL